VSKILSTNEIEKIILDYIEDDRKNQAILLNGEWGCGKTFFIKEMLIPQIDKEKYQIFQISLYGVSSIEIIQDMIYGKWIENVVSEKTEKFGPFWSC
jgi:predicted AAA+ superfamily ATPase